jgi:ribonuclease BN (tRNA processing enzyme)
VKLYVLGVGDTFSEKHVTHSLLLEHDGFRLAIDCPDSYRRVLAQARSKANDSSVTETLDLFKIDDVLITHVHGDHMNGLEGVGYFKHFAQKKACNLHTLAAVKEGLWEGRLGLPMGQLWNGTEFRKLSFADYFAWNELPEGGATSVGPFTISTRRTKHHVPTSALFVECAGATIGISSDTAFDRDLIDWLARADLVIHETNHGPAHTAYADLLTLDPAIKQKMRVIHYPDEFAGGEIAHVVEGEVIDLG